MPKVLIRGVEPVVASLRGRTNGFMTSIDFEGDLTKEVCEKMGWDVLEDGSEQALRAGIQNPGLTGSFGAGSLTLVPSGSKIADGTQIGFDLVKGFKVMSREPAEGSKKVPKQALHFTVKSPLDETFEIIRKFWKKHKGQKCAAHFEYEEQAPIKETTPPDAGGSVEE